MFAMDFGRAVSAVFCPPRASKDARAADFAAAKSFWVEDGCGRRSMGSSLYIFTLLCDEFCVRRIEFTSHTVAELKQTPCPEQFREILPYYLIKYNGKKDEMGDGAVQLSLMDNSDIVFEDQ